MLESAGCAQLSDTRLQVAPTKHLQATAHSNDSDISRTLKPPGLTMAV